MAVETDVVIDEKVKKKIDTPPKYKVIFLNDDHTPVEWVIELLIRVFKYTETNAEQLTMTIHHEDSAVVGVYTHEIAEQKSSEAILQSRDRGFPLQIKIEQE